MTPGTYQPFEGQPKQGSQFDGLPQTMLAAALRYAKRGFPVFPVHNVRNGVCSCGKKSCEHPGNHPRTKHGFKDATVDSERIAQWWTMWQDANIGIPTGPASGLLFLDIDPRNKGDESWESLVAKHGQPPDTAEQVTGGGGRHIAFRDPGVPVPKELAPGIDIKSTGGYIVVAPSIHATGRRYEWDGIQGAKALLDPAPVPTWLLECFAARLRRKTKAANGDSEKFHAGERNNGLTALVGKMRHAGMQQQSIEEALLKENRIRCKPPLDDAEVRRIAESVARYEPAQRVWHVTGTENWSEPVPFGNAAPDEIPTGCLPGWLGEMAQATADSTETPFDLAALLSLSVASACIAGKTVVSPEQGYVEPSNVFVCPAMESGNRKTAVFTKLLAPFGEWERDQIAEIEPERQRLASERKTQEARIDRLRKKAASVEDSAHLVREIQQLEATLPVVPPMPRLYVDDCTPEKLAAVMSEQGGRIAVFSDEGGVFELLAGRYSKGVPNIDLWLKGHSGSPVRVDRADARRSPILLDQPHLTVGISPQPDVIESLRDKPGFRGRGLLARFLYGLPKSRLGYRTLEPRPVPGDVEHRYRTGVHRLLDYSPKDVIHLRLTTEAYSEWKDFQRAVELQFRDGGELQWLKDWGSKLPGAALRIAGVFQVVEHIGRSSIEIEIQKSTIVAAVEFATALISHAQAVFALMERDISIEHAVKLVAWIVKHAQPSFTVRDCFRAHQARFKRVDALFPVLVLLEQHGYIRRAAQDSSGGRRPSDVCEVNPVLLVGI
jgi:hypothetical protein